MAIGLVAVLAPAQLLIGHESGKVAHEHQPTKVAVMEGWWETDRQSTILLGWPDDAAEKTHVLLQTPKGWGGWVVTGDANAVIKGLKAWPRGERPPTVLPFWGFRIMVGMGLLMIAMGWWGAILWLRRSLERTRIFHWAALLSGPAGFIAVLTGWIAAEVGRQPYVVFGQLRTAEAVSPVTTGAVSSSLLLFMAVYAVVFSAGVIYIGRLIVKGPEPGEDVGAPQQAPGNPLAMPLDPDDRTPKEPQGSAAR